LASTFATRPPSQPARTCDPQRCPERAGGHPVAPSSSSSAALEDADRDGRPARGSHPARETIRAVARYRAEVLEELARHGLIPGPDTPPERANELLKSIYIFEIRDARLRHRERERVLGPQPLEPYRREIRALQERYPVLRLPAHHWLER
jgi:hypothetical protein